MKYEMTHPCDDCPFRRKGGIRLRSSRAAEIGGMMLSLQGGEFPCHKTTVSDGDGDREVVADSQHCAGALIFAEKNGNATQMMRIMERTRDYDPTRLSGHDDVFDDLDEMIETQ